MFVIVVKVTYLQLILHLFELRGSIETTPHVRHDSAFGSGPGFGSRLPRSRPGRDNCAEALSPHRVTTVGKLLKLTCLGGDWPSYTFILTIFSDCLCVNLL